MDMVHYELYKPSTFFFGLCPINYYLPFNRVPLRSIDKTSYEIWNGKRLILSYLKDLMRDAYVKHILFEKLGVKLDKYKFVGYPKETIGYYLYHPVEQKYLYQNILHF
jgi:hypothetical protein